MGNLGFTEIMIILVVVLLVFGAKRLPEIGSSMGKGIREFKRSLSDTADALRRSRPKTGPRPPRVSWMPLPRPRRPAETPSGSPNSLSARWLGRRRLRAGLENFGPIIDDLRIGPELSQIGLNPALSGGLQSLGSNRPDILRKVR